MGCEDSDYNKVRTEQETSLAGTITNISIVLV